MNFIVKLIKFIAQETKYANFKAKCNFTKISKKGEF